MSLLALVFIAVHVATAIADPYVSIAVVAVVIPFTSAYEPFWLGIGAMALVLAIICGVVVGGAVLWRVAGAIQEVPRAERAAHILAHTRHGGAPHNRPGGGRHPAGGGKHPAGGTR
jgi:threonine/homoserine/homoserine lactone efflux protein